MVDLVVQVIIATVPAISLYLIAINKSKNEREKMELEIRRIEKEMEKQAQLYEKNAQTDVTKTVFNEFIKNSTFQKFLHQQMMNEIRKAK